MKAIADDWPQSNRLLWRVVAGVGILLTAAAAWLYAHPNHEPLPTKGVVVTGGNHIVVSKDVREALDIQTAEIVNRPLPETLLAYATVVSPWQSHAFASSRLPGRIVRLSAKPGQVVAEGEVLAEVGSIALEALQLEILEAKIAGELSQNVLTVIDNASKSGAIPLQQIIEARSKHQQNLNALDIAKSKWLSVGLSQQSLDALLLNGPDSSMLALPVRSPVRGTVIHGDVSIGRGVEASEHLFEIVDLSTVWVRIDVLEKDIRRVHLGQKVLLQFTAYPGKTFESTVVFLGIWLDPHTHVSPVWAKLENSGNDPEFLPGMAGQAQLVLPAAPAAKTIPAAALISDGVDRYVLVEEAKATGKSEYRKRSVTVLRQTPEWAEIQSPDLLPGDRVVTQGSPQLSGFLTPGVLKLSPQMERTIGLRLEAARPQVVEDIVTLTGMVDVPPNLRGFTSTPLAGTLERILVEPGQKVEAGQIVAEVASLELQNLQLDLVKEELLLKLLHEQYGQIKNIKSAVSERALLELESNLAASRSRRDNLRSRLTWTGLSHEQLASLVQEKKLVQTMPVRAPLAGLIGNVEKALGQAVRAEEPLIDVYDLSKPWIQALVTERDLVRAGPARSARVKLVSDPQTTLPGQVLRSAKVFAGDTQSLAVWIELDDYPGGRLQHGQLATVSLIVAQPAPTLAVARQAVVREGTQAFVFVRQPDGTFDRRPVNTGRADDRWLEITAGLAAGEMIAVAGAAELQTAYASLR